MEKDAGEKKGREDAHERRFKSETWMKAWNLPLTRFRLTSLIHLWSQRSTLNQKEKKALGSKYRALWNTRTDSRVDEELCYSGLMLSIIYLFWNLFSDRR